MIYEETAKTGFGGVRRWWRVDSAGASGGRPLPFRAHRPAAPSLATDTAPASRWRSPRDAAGRRSWQLVAGFRGPPAPSPRPGRDPSRPPAGTARSPPI